MATISQVREAERLIDEYDRVVSLLGALETERGDVPVVFETGLGHRHYLRLPLDQAQEWLEHYRQGVVSALALLDIEVEVEEPTR